MNAAFVLAPNLALEDFPQGCLRSLPARARVQITWDGRGQRECQARAECGEIDELK